MAEVKLFLSTVSAEFGSYREALRHALDRPNVTVKIQEDFIVSGTPTLEMLDDYIKSCDGVIHLVGDMTGSMARPQSLAAMKDRYPDLASRLPPVAACLDPDGPPLSYTQWEAWLALLHGCKLFIAVPAAEAPRDPRYALDPEQQGLQAAHLQRLRQMERYPGVSFTSADHMAREVLRSFVLHLLVEAGLSRRPSTLPYLPLPGNLFTGRSGAMERITQLLGPIPTTAAAPSTVVALHGIGGVGKSRLAIEHAWRTAARHSAVLFAAAETVV